MSDIDATVGRYTIERIGQEPPRQGDKVVVRVNILLPAINGNLHPDLQFQERLTVGGHTLYHNWGTPEGKEERRVSEHRHAATWREAEAQAEEWACAELERLRAAVRERARRLRCA